ncbi:MAG: phosphoribosylaminoimidazole-succinocarboxamide synthase [Pseudoalteromonas tetraodonis]|jgi:phosphoribosylaminoimidazole-succinocarboxamide synthase
MLSEVPLSALETPFYEGSVQRLFAVPGDQTKMVCETTAVGSVFDVGAIFSIDGSDTGRAVFRHVLYTKLGQPETWQRVAETLKADAALDPAQREELLSGLLERYCQNGAKTHHVGMLDANTGAVVTDGLPENESTYNVVRRYDVKTPPQVRLLGHPLYDYAQFPGMDKYVVPLEVIVRFGLTSGSSVYKKYLKLGDAQRVAFQQEMGVDGALEAWQYLRQPIVDFTSKYEPEDRAVSKQEAIMMSGLAADQFVDLGKLAVLGAWVVRNMVEEMGLRLWDLKWEFARDGDDLVFVDTIDTDSIRATGESQRGGRTFAIHFNKQAMRDYYEIAHADWMAGVNDAKSKARATGEPFVKLLRAGQEAGHYPQDPQVDQTFMNIQVSKMALVKNRILERITADEARDGLAKAGAEELAFYDGIGKLEELASHNAI